MFTRTLKPERRAGRGQVVGGGLKQLQAMALLGLRLTGGRFHRDRAWSAYELLS